MSSNNEYEQQQFWDKLINKSIELLSLDEIIERYGNNLTEDQIKRLKEFINE